MENIESFDHGDDDQPNTFVAADFISWFHFHLSNFINNHIIWINDNLSAIKAQQLAANYL